MAPKKKNSDKINDALVFLKDNKVTQAVNVLESMQKKMVAKAKGAKSTRKLSDYNIFVKKHFAEVLATVSDNKDAMRKIAVLWDEHKKNNKKAVK
jgi:hypothetical protein